MNGKIKLAIVIPYYKIDFFEETLKSLADQTNKSFNIYIGNDNSPEDPQDLILKYNYENNITYHAFDENYGSKGLLTEQWDRCIALSQNEEWLMILADDDYVSPNFVQSFYDNVNGAQNLNIHLLRFKMRRVTFDNQFLIDLEQPDFYPGNKYLWDDELHKRFISISENVFSRSIYTERGLRKYPLAWRVPFMMYMDFANDKNVMGINSSFVAIRRSENQLTRRRDMDTFKIKSMKICYRDLIKEYSSFFSYEQNLHFLKTYSYYNNYAINEITNLKSYYKYGGFMECLKFIAKKTIY